MKVERALLSVSDKTGIVEFAKGLADLGVEILSTGGTAKALREGGVEVVDVSDFTGHPEMMDGRVKTLHPIVHGGILARRDTPEHMAALDEYGNGRIDLVAVNLYPFEKTVAREDATFEECVEQIDIGGPTLIRAAAKNHADVLIVTLPEQQEAVLEALRAGEVSEDFRKKLAWDAFATTAKYDAAITRWFGGRKPPKSLRKDDGSGDLGLRKVGRLRHGDNAWQDADLFLTGGDGEPCAVRARSVGPASPTSLRELIDVDRALELVKQYTEPTVAIVREGVPVGAALGKTHHEALTQLIASGACRTAGGALALNGTFSTLCLDALAESADLPVSIIAPGFSEKAGKALIEGAGESAPRLLDVGSFDGRGCDADHVSMRRVVGGLVLQQRDLSLLGQEEPDVASEKKPGKDDKRDLYFAFGCAKHSASCSAALVLDGVLVGLGSGRPDMSRAIDLALREAGERASGAVLALDAALAHDDVALVEDIAAAGVTAILMPSGLADGATKVAADEASLALVIAERTHVQ
jgi:phosphoribosylaminoimidazolecarboxamide formyltransferase / IMP cyclohydrolase